MSKIANHAWKIVTVSQPVMFHRTLDEVWLLNVNRRYILNAEQVAKIEEYVDTCSDFENATLYNRLIAGKSLSDARVLVERMRDRGIGDLMFLTGPFAFLNHLAGQKAKIDVYTLADRGMVLTHNTDLHCATPMAGPIEYDSLRNYNYHWLISNVTEYDEESDQLNVYDALYRQLGYDPADIDPQWKRPKAACVPEDYKHLDQMFKMVAGQRKIDLRHTGYYLVSPFAAATVRSMNYTRWLEIIRVLSTRRPVVVCGISTIKLPDTDMSAGQFIQTVNNIGGGVINMIDGTPLRVLMALISRAKAFIGLDSGPLYLAQGLRTPAISLWGSHDPGVRLGYDKDYMDLAIWNDTACPHAPCFAYSRFPENKCPQGRFQQQCVVYNEVTVDSVLSKVDMVESNNAKLGAFKVK